MEHQIKVIKDDDVLQIWHKLNSLNEKIIFCYTKILPVIYGFFSLIFFIFYFKKYTFPNIYFSDYPLITFFVSAALFVLTCFAGNLPILIEKDPYFNRKQSGQLCALDVDSHKHNLIILYKTIGESRHSADAIENFSEDILFLKRAIFITRNLGANDNLKKVAKSLRCCFHTNTFKSLPCPEPHLQMKHGQDCFPF